MSICWHCYWGWPKPIADIYHEALRRLNGDDDAMEYGPAHIVWADENFDCAQRCLDTADEWFANRQHEWDKWNEGLDQKAYYEPVLWSLRELAKLDPALYESPEGYDGWTPSDYPPPADWEMVKV